MEKRGSEEEISPKITLPITKKLGFKLKFQTYKLQKKIIYYSVFIMKGVT